MLPWPGTGTDTNLLPWTLNAPSLESRSVKQFKQFKMPPLSPDQTYGLHIAAMVSASLSITAGLMASVWFFRMRRSFRHDLIMMLIFSDMLKAFWVLVFPSVELVHGSIKSTSAFCQASGFFFSLSIELSDLCVAMICIHTALYIFRGEQGLYPFRRYVHALCAIVPTLMASLAFIESPGYVNTAVIFFLCLAIYVYVRVWMQRFGSNHKDSKNTLSRVFGMDYLGTSNPHPLQTQATSVPATPLSKTHGLIQSPISSPEENTIVVGEDLSRQTLSTMNMDQMNIAVPALAHPSASKLHSARAERIPSFQNWSSSQRGHELGNSADQSERPSDVKARVSLGTTRWDSDGMTAPFEIQPHEFLRLSVPAGNNDAFPRLTETFEGYQSRSLDLAAIVPSRTPSLRNLFTVLKHTPSDISYDSNMILAQSDIDSSGVVKTRENILRQLHLLFVYPLVYVAIWILPCIVHLTGFGKGAPYDMRVASLVSLCLHGFADTLVFSLKEKPWKHAKPFSINCFKFWRQREMMHAAGPRAGRTREEMVIDGRLARKRRDQEEADQKLQRQEWQGIQPVGKPSSEWWDNQG